MEKAVFFVSMCVVLLSSVGVHRIPEGHIGLYWRFGSLLEDYTEPGYQWCFPITTSFSPLQLTIQVEKVNSVPCGTSSGILIHFDLIEVVHRLSRKEALETVRNYTIDYAKLWIDSNVHDIVNTYCSKFNLQQVYIEKFNSIDEVVANSLQQTLKLWTPGIEIIAVRVTKPRIPESIRLNYEKMEAEKTRLLVTNQTQQVLIAQSETERAKAIIEAKKQLEVAKINVDRMVYQKEKEREVSNIENQIYLEKEKALADANYYRMIQDAEMHLRTLSRGYLDSLKAQYSLSNTKLYFGSNLPQSIVTWN